MGGWGAMGHEVATYPHMICEKTKTKTKLLYCIATSLNFRIFKYICMYIYVHMCIHTQKNGISELLFYSNSFKILNNFDI